MMMKNFDQLKISVLLAFVFLTLNQPVFSQLPVNSSHPRIILDQTMMDELLVKKNSNDADWTSILEKADEYAASTVLAWTPATANTWGGQGTIFYSYCGSSYEDAALTLGLAHQLTKTNNAGANNTAYSNKLMELIDEILNAYTSWPPSAAGDNIFQYNTSYATRHMGKVVGIIYDWCYDELGTNRKNAMITMMENWFEYMRIPLNVYQGHDHSTGNYFFGHVMCAAWMGYAIHGDSPKADHMIAFARQRITGKNDPLLTSSDLSEDHFTQSFLGGLPSAACRTYLGPSQYTGAPQKDGIPIQGWAYGGAVTETIIDYCMMVKTATGENIADSLMPFFSKTAEALIHSFTPNRFQQDNSNDVGSFVGSMASYSLPLRLAAILKDEPIGPQIQYFYEDWIRPVDLVNYNVGYPNEAWESFLFSRVRAKSPFDLKPYYPIPPQNTYSSVAINDALHKYYMRSDWSENATWITYDLGAAYYDDHQHNNAGHFKILRGSDYDSDDALLIGANETGNSANGAEGETNYGFSSNFANTLFVDDYSDYDGTSQVFNTTVGGQFGNGYDEPTHVEQHDQFSYFRADHTSAYFNSYYQPDTSTRSIRYFYRSFLYLRESNLVLSYDQFEAKNSTHANGQYKKHLRWHFLKEPTISGNQITAVEDESKLSIHTVIPDQIDIQKVDESNNPDNTFGSVLDYLFNTQNWRAEVSVQGNPLQQTILTVMQPGSITMPEMNTQAIYSSQMEMEGVQVIAQGKEDIILLNKSISKFPTAINSVSYPFSLSDQAWHTLIGLNPNASYLVSFANGVVTVSQDISGQFVASPSGVLRFQLSALNGLTEETEIHVSIYPNPTSDKITIVSKETIKNELEIYDHTGNYVSSARLNAEKQISLKNLSPGMYFLKLSSDKGNKTIRIIRH